MNKRITKQEMFMRMAQIASTRSTCKRLQVGAVITDAKMLNVLAIGYNGNYAGGPNTCDTDEVGNCGCFPINSLVKTKNGDKRIQNIKIGDFVLTHKNRYKRVTKIYRKEKYKGKYVLLNSGLTFGSQGRFVSTEEHPILVERGNKIFWEKAINIKVGDTVFCESINCSSCGKKIPYFREMCSDCFAKSSSGRKQRLVAKNRMIENNPMKALTKITRIVINDKRVKKLIERQKKSSRELEEKFRSHIKEMELDKKYRCIIVDHCKIKPDIILIDFKNKKVIAYEYEKWHKNIRKEKYENNYQYDDVIWYSERKRSIERELHNGFSRVIVTKKEIQTREPKPIYNLEVEEDNSYVCQRIVVHNCIHSELNAIIKADNRMKDKVLFVTDSPCRNCAKLIINSGFSRIYYRNEYRLSEGIDLLKKVEIKVFKI